MAGRRLELLSGLAEIEFNAGSRVILEGPVIFEPDSTGAGFLQLGKLTAAVPKRAAGFTIQTPIATVVDLGTEFGVEVDRSGVTEMHVFQGQIEVTSSGETATIKRRLTAGRGARFSANGADVLSVHADAERFRRARQMASGLASTSGAVTFLTAAPQSVAPGALEDSRHVLLFLERENVVLRRNLEVTFSSPGTYQSFTGGAAVVPAGTRVDSYLLHFDAVGVRRRTSTANGSVRFSRPILGVIAHDKALDASDGQLGHRRTTYPTGAKARQADDKGDKLSLSSDRHTLSLDKLVSMEWFDQVRVLVAAPVGKDNHD